HRIYEKGRFRALEPLIGNGLFMSSGSFWLRQRRLIQPAFHRRRLAALARTMTTLTAEQLDGWSQAVVRADPLDLVIELMRVTERIAARTLFSAEVGADVDAVIHSITSVF